MKSHSPTGSCRSRHRLRRRRTEQCTNLTTIGEVTVTPDNCYGHLQNRADHQGLRQGGAQPRGPETKVKTDASSRMGTVPSRSAATMPREGRRFPSGWPDSG